MNYEYMFSLINEILQETRDEKVIYAVLSLNNYLVTERYESTKRQYDVKCAEDTEVSK